MVAALHAPAIIVLFYHSNNIIIIILDFTYSKTSLCNCKTSILFSESVPFSQISDSSVYIKYVKVKVIICQVFEQT